MVDISLLKPTHKWEVQHCNCWKNMENQYIKGTLKVLGQKMCFNQSGQYKTAHCRLNMFEDLTFMNCFWTYAFLKTCRSAKQLMLPIYCSWLRKTLQETPRFARRKCCFPEFASLNRSIEIKQSTTAHDLTTRKCRFIFRQTMRELLPSGNLLAIENCHL